MTKLKAVAGYRVLLLISGLSFLLSLSSLARAQQLPDTVPPLADRVLVIRNANSPISRSVADDYARRRGIRHTFTIACADSALDSKNESISFTLFQQTIAAPVAEFLASHPAIDFIVLTKGIPIRISDAPQGQAPGPLALDSCLASWQYAQLPDAVRIEVTDPAYGPRFHGVAWANRFWNSRQRFSHARFGGYLVTRLDGYTEADAKALTTRSLAAEQSMRSRSHPPAKILLDICPGFGFDDKSKVPHSLVPFPASASVKIIQESKFSEFNTDLQLTAEILSSRAIPVELDLTDRFIGHVPALAGYVS